MFPMIEVSYSEARARFAELLDSVADDHDVVRIRRQGNKRAAVLIDADDYASLEETAYLLSSPANARHILRSLAELEAGHGRVYETVDDVWRDLEAEVEPLTKSGPISNRRSRTKRHSIQP